MQGVVIHRGSSAAVLLTFGLGGCSGWGGANVPPDPNLYPAQYRAEIAETLRATLTAPVKIRDAQISAPALKPLGGAPRYVSCARYRLRDSKNQDAGGGDKVAIFWAGRVNQFLPATPELCGDAVYQRFPEAETLTP